MYSLRIRILTMLAIYPFWWIPWDGCNKPITVHATLEILKQHNQIFGF